jgi:hypothetical protein
MTAFLFTLVLFFFKGRRKLIISMTVIVISAGLFVGVSRAMSSSAVSELSEVQYFSTLFSEAIFPNYPLLHHITSGPNLLWGTSYLRLPALASPTFGLWDKPLYLSQKFALEYANNSMGYAYTPLGEGYANFGAVAAFIVPLLLVAQEGLLLGSTFLRASRLATCLPGLVFLSLALDIDRGEFASIVVEMVIYSALFWVFLCLCRVGLKGQR